MEKSGREKNSIEFRKQWTISYQGEFDKLFRLIDKLISIPRSKYKIITGNFNWNSSIFRPGDFYFQYLAKLKPGALFNMYNRLLPENLSTRGTAAPAEANHTIRLCLARKPHVASKKRSRYRMPAARRIMKITIFQSSICEKHLLIEAPF